MTCARGCGMRFRTSAVTLLAAFCAAAGDLPYYSIRSADAGPWPAILSGIGLLPSPDGNEHVRVIVFPKSVPAVATQPRDQIVVLVGLSPFAEALGIHAGSTTE